MLTNHRARRLSAMASRGWCALMVVVLLSPNVADAQLPDLIKEFLPKPQSAQPIAPPSASRQEVIPLARPADDGEIVVEEQGEGLISLKVRDASLRQVIAMT